MNPSGHVTRKRKRNGLNVEMIIAIFKNALINKKNISIPFVGVSVAGGGAAVVGAPVAGGGAAVVGAAVAGGGAAVVGAAVVPSVSVESIKFESQETDMPHASKNIILCRHLNNINSSSPEMSSRQLAQFLEE